MAYYIMFLWIPQNVTYGNVKHSKAMDTFSYMHSMLSIDLIDVIMSKNLGNLAASSLMFYEYVSDQKKILFSVVKSWKGFKTSIRCKPCILAT